MNFRLLEKADFQKGYLELLKQLTEVGNISKADYLSRFYEILNNVDHKVFVMELDNRIVSCATLLIEPKFIHDCGYVGHIEDVVVDKVLRGQSMGKKIINYLSDFAEKNGCYKIILDCSDKNVGFYEKCEYARKGAYMAKYLDPVVRKQNVMSQISKFCSYYKTPLILTGVGLTIATGYFLYQHYTEDDDNGKE